MLCSGVCSAPQFPGWERALCVRHRAGVAAPLCYVYLHSTAIATSVPWAATGVQAVHPPLPPRSCFKRSVTWLGCDLAGGCLFPSSSWKANTHRSICSRTSSLWTASSPSRLLWSGKLHPDGNQTCHSTHLPGRGANANEYFECINKSDVARVVPSCVH